MGGGGILTAAQEPPIILHPCICGRLPNIDRRGNGWSVFCLAEIPEIHMFSAPIRPTRSEAVYAWEEALRSARAFR
jgi:hypothetical protein